MSKRKRKRKRRRKTKKEGAALKHAAIDRHEDMHQQQPSSIRSKSRTAKASDVAAVAQGVGISSSRHTT
jgi:hypothetical protein